MMMKSAIDWLMGKSESLNNDLTPVTTNNGTELNSSSNVKNTPKENSLCNGHFNENTYPKATFSRTLNEETSSPWGRTLTPKSPKGITHIGQKVSPSKVNSTLRISKRLSTSTTWDDMR